MADNDSNTETDSPYHYLLTPEKEIDRWLGSLTAVLSVVGLLGNIPALLYFSFLEQKSLPDKLYIAIITVDILTNFVFVFSASFLLNERNSILCNQREVHLVAATLLRFSAKMSSFLVAVLSVLRSIVIVKPHKARQIRPRTVAYIVTGCAVVILLKDVVPQIFGWVVAPAETNLDCPRLSISNKMPGIVSLLIQTVDTIELFLTSVVVFVSFIVSAIFLLKKRFKPPSNLDKEGRSWQVSVTIALFTALFLLCNLPYLAYYLFAILAKFVRHLEEKLMSYILKTRSKWILWNGNNFFSFLPVQLNAALNPCLYLWRMPRYREQLSIWWTIFKEKLKKL